MSNKGPPSRAMVLPFAHKLTNPVSFAPIAFQFIGSMVPRAHMRAALTGRLTLFIILCSPLRVTSSRVRGCRTGPRPFGFVMSYPAS